MVGEIEALFPKLQGTGYQVTSASDDAYNCIAWAAGHTDDWWWPDLDCQQYWPEGVQRLETLSGFRQAFALLGYCDCEQED